MANQPTDRKRKAPAKRSAGGGVRKGGPTSAAQWKTKAEGHEVEVPSGNVALVRRVGMEAFIAKGVIPNSLMPAVQKAIKSGGEFDTAEVMQNLSTEMLEEILDLYDAVVLDCVVQPEVLPVPKDEQGNVIPVELREDGAALYVDEVDFQDKVYLFQWVVGGTTNLESFRTEQKATLDALRSG